MECTGEESVERGFYEARSGVGWEEEGRWEAVPVFSDADVEFWSCRCRDCGGGVLLLVQGFIDLEGGMVGCYRAEDSEETDCDT